MPDSSFIRDELPYGPEIEPGILLLHRPPARHQRMQHQCALCTLWEITPFNIDLIDDEDADELAGRWSRLIRSLPAGAILDVRMDSAPGHCVPAWEDSRRALTGQHIEWQRQHIASGMHHTQEGRPYRLRENHVTIGLRFPAPLMLPANITQYLQMAQIWRSRQVQKYFDQKITAHLNETLRIFEGRTRAFEIALLDIGLKPVRLSGQTLLNRLAIQLDPSSPEYPYEPGVPLRDQMGAKPVKLDSDGCLIGERRASILQPHRGIARTFPGLLSAARAPEGRRITFDLASLIGESHASISVVTTIPDHGEVINMLQSRQSFAWVQRRGGRGEVRSDVAEQEEELSEIIAHTTSERDALLPTGVQIIAWDTDEAIPTAHAIADRLQTLGITAEIEKLVGNTLFLQSLSGGTDIAYPSIRTMGGMPSIPGIHTAKLMPVWGGFRGTGESSKNGVLFLNRLGDPVFFDPFDGPGSPHGNIVGLTRSGKSAATNTLLHQMLPTGARAYILDRYRSYEQLCKIHGGIHYTMSLDHPICMGLMDGPLNAVHRATVLAALSEMCGAGEADALTRTERATLIVLLNLWAASLKPGDPRTLTAFVNAFDELAPRIRNENAGSICDNLRMSLMPYYGDGEYAGFIDGPNEMIVGDHQLVAVDIAELREVKEIEAVMVALFFLRFGDIVRHPARLGTPKFMIADEVAFLLQSPATAKFFITLARALARFNCSLITITQNLQDFNNDVGEIIAGQSGFRMIFRVHPREKQTLIDEGLGQKTAELLLNLERSHTAATCYLTIKSGEEGVIRIVAPEEFITEIGQDPVHRLQREEAIYAQMDEEK